MAKSSGPKPSYSNSGGQELGPCPICGRMMIDGPSTDRHHWVPKSQHGEKWDYLHRVCHKKIHSLFTEKYLAREMNSADAILADVDMQKFVKWVRKQPLESNSRVTKPNAGKKSR